MALGRGLCEIGDQPLGRPLLRQARRQAEPGVERRDRLNQIGVLVKAHDRAQARAYFWPTWPWLKRATAGSTTAFKVPWCSTGSQIALLGIMCGLTRPSLRPSASVITVPRPTSPPVPGALGTATSGATAGVTRVAPAPSGDAGAGFSLRAVLRARIVFARTHLAGPTEHLNPRYIK